MNYEEKFWASYSENHFWRLNDKSKVKENSVYYDAIYDSLLPVDRSAKILDVGCGGGHFLAYLVRKGYTQMVGVDLSPGLVDFVRTTIWPEVVHADLFEHLKDQQAIYDVIVANDIIEHLDKKNIIRLLNSCYAGLKVGGHLIIKTANMSHPLGLRSRYVDFTHEIGFTEHSLYEVCAASGYASIKILSEFHARSEPRIYGVLRRLYPLFGITAPQVISPNVIAVCEKREFDS